ncbi:conserved hypothetical protein [Candidatus Nitrotoga sp. 1052]|nr:conserved hypothetical protein [Candidatus Nitrotoga sp. 1052]
MTAGRPIDMQSQDQASQYIVSIRQLGETLGQLSAHFRNNIPNGERLADDKYSTDNWRRNTYGNILIRLRQLTENNFRIVETLSLLVTARYIFEATIWLRLFQKDKRYCLIYYRELLKTQLRFYEDSLAQLHREIALLKRFGEMDHHENSMTLEDIRASTSSADFAKTVRSAMDRVDSEAAKCFSIYADQARTNGYEFQAYLVGTQAIPPVEENISRLKSEIAEFEKNVPADVQNLLKGRWQWRGMSDEAGMLEEHDYIYAYASKLVHATPASITTDQKNLEMPEVCIFLRYIQVKLLEIIDLASLQPAM